MKFTPTSKEKPDHEISKKTVNKFFLSLSSWQARSTHDQNLKYFVYSTDKKENQIFILDKEIQDGAVAKSYMTHGLLIYGEIFAHFLIY